MALTREHFALTLSGSGSASVTMHGTKWDFVTRRGVLHVDLDVRSGLGDGMCFFSPSGLLFRHAHVSSDIATPVTVKNEPHDDDIVNLLVENNG